MKFLFLFLMMSCKAAAQDYSGVWTGYLAIKNTQVPYELVISRGENDVLSGYSLTVFVIGETENTGIKSVSIKNKKSSISIEDDQLVFDDYTIKSKRVRLYGKLSFEAGSNTILVGTFFTRSPDRTSFSGAIRLNKKEDFAQTRLITHLRDLNLINGLSFYKKMQQPAERTDNLQDDTGQLFNSTLTTGNDSSTGVSLKPGLKAAALPAGQKTITADGPGLFVPAQKTHITIKAAADLASRKTELISTIYFVSDSLVLSLYDNGEVDGDTVSVLVNNQVMIARKGLSTVPVRTTIYTPAGTIDSLSVIMYAENLGRIGSNTGLLVIEDGTNKHQVRFEGDRQKNSGVHFLRKKD